VSGPAHRLLGRPVPDRPARLAAPLALRRACAGLLVAVALAGCGGGGDGAATPAASPAPLAGGADTTCGLANFRDDTLRMVNARRAMGASCGDHGSFAPAGPLAWNDRLEQAAYGHSADMATNNYFAHESQDGRTPADRVSAAGYAWSAIGENIAAGYPDVAAVVDGWMTSPGHCANIMTAAFRELGMACADNATSQYGRYFTMDLATPR
jgi:uncharacterized protein YkwD